jgi:uncharacterized protein (TIGR01777 family)
MVQKNEMRVVVTGGTGFIGSALVPALREAGHEVTLTSRKPKAAEIAWTPKEEGPWVETAVEADVVFHLAGAGVADAPWTEARKEEIRQSRIVPCEILSRAMARASKKPRLFVSASAIGLYGFVEVGECDESSPPGTDFLARVCVDWEAAAEPARRAGVRVVTPRIGIVFGRDGGPLEKMIQPFRAMVGGPLGSGRQIISWVHIRDAVRALLHLMDGDHSGPFNIVAPSAVTCAALASASGRARHRPSFMRTPGFAIELALGAERAQIVLRGQRAVPKRLLAAGFEFSFPTIDVALADLL